MSTLEILRYVLGIPVIAGAVWTLARPRKEVKTWMAAALLLYGFLYIVIFHYGFKIF